MLDEILKNLDYRRAVEEGLIPTLSVYLPAKRYPNGIKDQDCYTAQLRQELLQGPGKLKEYGDRLFSGQPYLVDQTISVGSISTVLHLWSRRSWLLLTVAAKKFDPSLVLRLLSQLALLRNQDEVPKAGLIFLCHAQEIVWDLSSWDHLPLLEALQREASWCDIYRTITPRKLYCPGVGYHVSSGGAFPVDIPFQIFISSPQSTQHAPNSERFLPKLKDCQGPYFVHSPYVLNLCRPDFWVTELLINQYQESNRIGAKGLVVHLGSQLTFAWEESLANMQKHLELTLKCPGETLLLVETAAGEGTDVCTSPHTLLPFLQRFSDPRLKLCLDSCHVFSAGYDPVWFFEQVKDYIRLVHFNDSEGPRGCRHDRHARAGTGCIGPDVLEELAVRCRSLKIPCVIE